MKTLLTTILLLFVTFGVTAKEVAIYNNIKTSDNTSSLAVSYAVKALKLDFNRKFGVHNPNTEKDVIELNFNIDTTIGEFDRYRIDFSNNSITFTGSDELGVIHAIYTFSEDVLGIDPFIHFTHCMPELEEEVKVNAKSIISKPFTYTHRGFFINDEDLVTGFQLEKLNYGFNLKFMERIYETMLRAKMTGVIPSTLVLADEPHLALASDMGLYIMQHHAEPLGSVPLYWPKNEPYSWSTNKEAFIDFWTKAIERQKGRNVIWTIGFRGLLDRDFWTDDPIVTAKSSDEEKAAVINEVVATQYELIKKITGNPNPLVTANLRGAVNGLYNKGLIKYPKGTIIQFTDSGGVFHANTWEDSKKCEYPMGVYQHVSYHNRRGHMRINTTDPNVLCEQMQMAYDHNLTTLCVLNVGNIKEKIFGIQQMVNYMNDFESFKDQKNDEYYDWYVQDKYKISSKSIARVYRDFIHTQFQFDNNSKAIGDEYYSYVVEQLMRAVCERTPKVGLSWGWAKDAKSDSFNDRFVAVLDVFSSKLDPVTANLEVNMQRAYDAQRELSGNQLDFYIVDAVLPCEKMFHLTSMLNDLCKSMKAYTLKDYHTAQLNSYSALQHLDGALNVEKKIEEAHTGDFKDWYRYDQNARTKQTKPFLECYHNMCINMKFLSLPYSQRNSKTESIQYKKEPFFKSEYQEELIYMENAR